MQQVACLVLWHCTSSTLVLPESCAPTSCQPTHPTLTAELRMDATAFLATLHPGNGEGETNVAEPSIPSLPFNHNHCYSAELFHVHETRSASSFPPDILSFHKHFLTRSNVSEHSLQCCTLFHPQVQAAY